MDLSFYLRGGIIGLSIAAVVGPMSVLCMQRTLAHGFRYGLISGLGIATADAAYGTIAAFGITIVASLLVSLHAWIRLIGGIFLIYLGITSLLRKPASVAGKAGEREITRSTGENAYGPAYLSTLGLTLTNPMTIISFAAIFAGLGVAGGRGSAANAALTVLGVFSGSTLWWCILTAGISLLRARLSPHWLLWTNRLSGAVIAAFGILAILSLLQR